jgi:hypothetical protein
MISSQKRNHFLKAPPKLLVAYQSSFIVLYFYFVYIGGAHRIHGADGFVESSLFPPLNRASGGVCLADKYVPQIAPFAGDLAQDTALFHPRIEFDQPRWEFLSPILLIASASEKVGYERSNNSAAQKRYDWSHYLWHVALRALGGLGRLSVLVKSALNEPSESSPVNLKR